MDVDHNNVTIQIPANPDYLRLIRLASTDIGSKAGFTIEDIEDFLIAVTEACSLAITQSQGAHNPSIAISFVLEPQQVVTYISPLTSDCLPETSLSAILLHQTVDSFICIPAGEATPSPTLKIIKTQPTAAR